MFHLVEWADSDEERIKEFIEAHTMRQAVDLMLEFLVPSMIRFYQEYLDFDSHSRWVAGHLLARELTEVKSRDLYRAYAPFKELKGDARSKLIATVMRDLELTDWVKPWGTKPGQPTSAWRVNPKIHLMFAERAEKEKKHRREVKASIEESKAPSCHQCHLRKTL